MIIHNVAQNSPEWMALHLGIPSASAAGNVIATGRGGGESQQRKTYMMRLLAERLTGKSASSFQGNKHTERGHVMEPEAVNLYQFLYDVDGIEEVGFITTDDLSVGASPDRLVGMNGCLEVKSKEPHLMLPIMLNNVMPEEHKPQVQSQLLIAELEWCDFICYWPDLPLVVIRQYRDEPYIAKLAQAYKDFNEELATLEEQARRLIA